MTISLLINIKTQFSTLEMAKKENILLIKKIREMDESNKFLSQQIQYATSDAFVAQKAREDFGMGEEGDVWLKLKPEQKVDLRVEEKKETEANYKQWLKLFTQ